MSNVIKFLNKYKRQIGEGVFGSLTAGGISAGLAYQGGEEELLPSIIGGAAIGLGAVALPRYGLGSIRKKLKTDAILSSKGYQKYTDDIAKQRTNIEEITKRRDRLDVVRNELNAISFEARKNKQYELFRNAELAKGVKDLPPSLSALDDAIAGLQKKKNLLYKQKNKAIAKTKSIESTMRSQRTSIREQQNRYQDKLVQDMIQNQGLLPHEARIIAKPEAADVFSIIKKTILGKPTRDMAMGVPIPYKSQVTPSGMIRSFDFMPQRVGTGAVPKGKKGFTPYFGDTSTVFPHTALAKPSKKFGGNFQTQGGMITLNPNIRMPGSQTVVNNRASRISLLPGQGKKSKGSIISSPTYADFVAAQKTQGLGHHLSHAQGDIISAEKALARLEARLDRYSKVQKNIPNEVKEALRIRKKEIGDQRAAIKQEMTDANEAIKNLKESQQAFLEARTKRISDTIDKSIFGLGGFNV